MKRIMYFLVTKFGHRLGAVHHHALVRRRALFKCQWFGFRQSVGFCCHHGFWWRIYIAGHIQVVG